MNVDRAEWAAAALRQFQCTTGCDYEDSLGDLLCDLMHWSDRNNFDFEAALCPRAATTRRKPREARDDCSRLRRPGDRVFIRLGKYHPPQGPTTKEPRPGRPGAKHSDNQSRDGHSSQRGRPAFFQSKFRRTT